MKEKLLILHNDFEVRGKIFRESQKWNVSKKSDCRIYFISAIVKTAKNYPDLSSRELSAIHEVFHSTSGASQRI